MNKLNNLLANILVYHFPLFVFRFGLKVSKRISSRPKEFRFFVIKPHIIFPRKNITNLTFETIAHNINALAGDVLGDVLGDVR